MNCRTTTLTNTDFNPRAGKNLVLGVPRQAAQNTDIARKFVERDRATQCGILTQREQNVIEYPLGCRYLIRQLRRPCLFWPVVSFSLSRSRWNMPRTLASSSGGTHRVAFSEIACSSAFSYSCARTGPGGSRDRRSKGLLYAAPLGWSARTRALALALLLLGLGRRLQAGQIGHFPILSARSSRSYSTAGRCSRIATGAGSPLQWIEPADANRLRDFPNATSPPIRSARTLRSAASAVTASLPSTASLNRR